MSQVYIASTQPACAPPASRRHGVCVCTCVGVCVWEKVQVEEEEHVRKGCE